jgi:putative phosphoesterase
MGTSPKSRNGAGKSSRRKPSSFEKTPRIAIVSDIHGNFEALKALPNHFDELWVLGDLVNYGPQPSEVIEFVRKRASVVVRGNHDDSVAFNRDPQCSTAFRLAAEETGRYTRSVLSEKHKGYLANLLRYRWVRRGRWTFYLCHAVPSDPLHSYYGKDIRKWKKELSVAGTDFLFVGHTHLQFSLRTGEQSVVNPGSIGQPKMGTPQAGYAIWENGSVTLHNYKYPVQKTAARVRSMPVSASTREFLVKVLQSGAVPKSEKEAKHVQNYSA